MNDLKSIILSCSSPEIPFSSMPLGPALLHIPYNIYQTSCKKDEHRNHNGNKRTQSEQDGEISRQATQLYKPNYISVTRKKNTYALLHKRIAIRKSYVVQLQQIREICFDIKRERPARDESIRDGYLVHMLRSLHVV